MLLNIKPLKNTTQVRDEIKKIVARQKKGTIDDLTPFSAEIDKLLPCGGGSGSACTRRG